MVELSSADIERIEQKWGVLTVPKGETRRAKQVRKNALRFKESQIETITKSLETWFKFHPNATKAEIKLRLERQKLALGRIQNEKTLKKLIARKKWDWREYSIDVGPVMNQGSLCNTCWAFAATDAAHASLQKNYLEDQNMIFYTVSDNGELVGLMGAEFYVAGDPSPFAQDLLNCMPIKKGEICLNGWHGDAFHFMVYGKGIPMCYADGYTDTDQTTGEIVTYRRKYVRGEKFECAPNCGYIKADAWDYVNSPPDKLPTVEMLKTALIEHGPLVAPIHYDDNLRDYKGGIFKGENMGMINHDVLLIGWSDRKKAWLVKNSWGKKWGENGFGWIRYGANNFGVFAAWIEARKW